MRAISLYWVMVMKDFLIRLLLLPICALALTISVVGALYCLVFSPATSWRQIIAIDQLTNASIAPFLNFVFGVQKGDPAFGNEDETISSVIGKLYDIGSGNKLVDMLYKFLEWFQRNHCRSSIEA